MKQKKLYETIPIRDMDREGLSSLNTERKLSLSLDDLEQIQKVFRELERGITDVEIEVLAQTWSEHCKHRTFNAEIKLKENGTVKTINGIFREYIKKVTDDISKSKPGFILSAFKDNAGFIKLDKDKAVGLKVETHNHPSALDPYGGANTGIGGVIRDILGAGKGARPVGNIDVFCLPRVGIEPTTPAFGRQGI